MHMDVTIMERSARLAIERAGEIMHAPDEGASSRVPSNPWGFTGWFRSVVSVDQEAFVKELRRRRGKQSKSRLVALDATEAALAKADQVDLPPMIPSALAAQEAVALKLLKRNINIRYEKLDLKRPPGIYLTKRAGSIGYTPDGLTAQLITLAETTAEIMRRHLAAGTRPDEVNPSYHPDKINDRWPAEGAQGLRDMETLAQKLEHLATRLRRLARVPLSEIVEGISELFGERIGAEVKSILTKRFDTRGGDARNQVQTATGNIKSPAVVAASPDIRPVPQHNFHSVRIPDEAEDE